MSAAHTAPTSPRPRSVSIAGNLAVSGSVAAIVALFMMMSQLDSVAVGKALKQFADDTNGTPAAMSVETLRTVIRYAVMVAGVMSAASAVLGVFVLMRHRSARIGLTVLGGFSVVWLIFGGVVGWLVAAYILVTLTLLWGRPARDWFASGDGGVPPPAPGMPASTGADWPTPSGWGPAPPPNWPPPSGPPPGPPASEAEQPPATSPPAEPDPDPADTPKAP